MKNRLRRSAASLLSLSLPRKPFNVTSYNGDNEPYKRTKQNINQ